MSNFLRHVAMASSDVCNRCFQSEVISDFIKEQGNKLSKPQRCTRCHNKSRYRLDADFLREKISSIIFMIYTHDNQHGLVSSAHCGWMEKGDDIRDFLPMAISLENICYKLFGIDTEREFYEFLVEDDNDGSSVFHDSYEDLWINMGCEWGDHDKIRFDWASLSLKIKTTFADGLLQNARFARMKEFKCLKRTFDTLAFDFSETIYRARKYKEENQEKYHESPSDFIGFAPTLYAKHNRFSPANISYGYFSKDSSTAIKEIRAKEGERAVIGKFSIKNVKLIDFRESVFSKILNDVFSDKFTAELFCSSAIIRNFLKDITKEVGVHEAALEYLPTQAISMFIRTLGYDGFIYDSSIDLLGENFLLFEKEKCEYISAEII